MKIKWKIYASPWIERIQRDVTLDRAHPTWRHVGLALSKVRETLLSVFRILRKFSNLSLKKATIAFATVALFKGPLLKIFNTNI